MLTKESTRLYLLENANPYLEVSFKSSKASIDYLDLTIFKEDEKLAFTLY
jgi:hypothetical protein